MQNLLSWPVKRMDGLDLGLPSGRWIYTDPLESICVVLDSERFEFWLSASHSATGSEMECVLRFLYNAGFEPMDEDECEPSLDERGWTKIPLVPIVPVDDTSLVELIGGKQNGGTSRLGMYSTVLGAAIFSVPILHNILNTLMEVNAA